MLSSQGHAFILTACFYPKGMLISEGHLTNNERERPPRNSAQDDQGATVVALAVGRGTAGTLTVGAPAVPPFDATSGRLRCRQAARHNGVPHDVGVAAGRPNKTLHGPRHRPYPRPTERKLEVCPAAKKKSMRMCVCAMRARHGQLHRRSPSATADGRMGGGGGHRGECKRTAANAGDRPYAGRVRRDVRVRVRVAAACGPAMANRIDGHRALRCGWWWWRWWWRRRRRRRRRGGHIPAPVQAQLSVLLREARRHRIRPGQPELTSQVRLRASKWAAVGTS